MPMEAMPETDGTTITLQVQFTRTSPGAHRHFASRSRFTRPKKRGSDLRICATLYNLYIEHTREEKNILVENHVVQ